MQLRPLRFALSGLCLLLAPGVRAADIYVSPTGNGNGNTASTPASLFSANTRVRAGDTVIMAGGVYGTAIAPTTGGNSSAWVTYRAADGALPIIDNAPGSGANLAVEYVRIDGIAARNHSSIGFSNQYVDMCNGGSAVSSGHFEFLNVIADANGISGIGFFCATGLRVEHAIIAHNGLGSSWSSGVNLYGARGGPTQSIVRGVVAFENVDISSARSDGSGFITDIGSEGALFENNLGFRNGGSCFRVTRSKNAVFINNSCFDNSKYDQYGDEIFFSNSGDSDGALIRNNILVPASGKSAIAGSGASSVPKENNITLSGGSTPSFWVSATGELDFNLRPTATDAIDKGSATSAPSSDIGFDPRCVMRQTGQSHPRCNSDCQSKTGWFSYAVDYEYIEAIGGVKACFQARTRTGTVDIGAYEYASAGGSGGNAGGGAGGSSAGTSAGGTSAGGGAGGSSAGTSAGGAGGSSAGTSAGGTSAGSSGKAGGGAGGTSAGSGGTSGSGVGGTSAGSGGKGGSSATGGGAGAAGNGAGGTGTAGNGVGGTVGNGGSEAGAGGEGGSGDDPGAGGASTAGTTGEAGTLGVAGNAGAAGMLGTAGVAGVAGAAGTLGASGSAGTSGAAGAAAGVPGVAGMPSGSSGTGGVPASAGSTAQAGSAGNFSGGGDESWQDGVVTPELDSCSCRLFGSSEPLGDLRAFGAVAFAGLLFARRRSRVR